MFCKKKKLSIVFELPKSRTPIHLLENKKKIIEVMSENSLLAKNVMNEIYKKCSDWPALIACLEDMNIRGKQLFYAFAYSDFDTNKLKNFVFTKNEIFIDSINLISVINNENNKVVPCGAHNILYSLSIFDHMSLLFSEHEKQTLIDAYDKAKNKKVQTAKSTEELEFEQ